MLLGHSDGASIALLYASRLPVAACIVLAPHVMVEDVSIKSINQAQITCFLAAVNKAAFVTPKYWPDRIHSTSAIDPVTDHPATANRQFASGAGLQRGC